MKLNIRSRLQGVATAQVTTLTPPKSNSTEHKLTKSPCDLTLPESKFIKVYFTCATRVVSQWGRPESSSVAPEEIFHPESKLFYVLKDINYFRVTGVALS